MTENFTGPTGTRASSRLAALTTTVTRLTTELAAVATELGAVAAEASTPPAAPPISPTLLTVEQAAERLGLSRSAVYLLIRDGELRSIAIGSRRRVPAVAIDAYVGQLLNGAA